MENGMFDLGQIQIQSLIVHEIPKHYLRAEDPGPGPILSDVESPLNSDVRNFFQEKIAGSLGRAAFEVEFDPDSSSRAPAIISGLLSRRPSALVTASQGLAQTLYECQGGISPSGLLTVVKAKVGQRPGIAIIKLEKEEGTRVQRTTIKGRSTFNVNHLRDLMLTGNTRIFKVGLFARMASTNDIEGLVCDKQKGTGTTVAFFFLQRFLGCRLTENPDITTGRFFNAAQRFISDDVTEPQVQAQYQVALAQELSSTRTTISPEAFANTNLRAEDRLPLLARVEEAGVATNSFPKDLTLVEPLLRKIQWRFQKGVTVVASSEQVGDVVQVEALKDGRTRLQVTDVLRDMGGHR
jgi:hypothetical protein